MPRTEAADEERLWKVYWADRSLASRNAICDFYWPTVLRLVDRNLAKRGCGTLADAILSYVAERLLGLTIPEYDPAKSVPFAAHLASHVRYAISDALRDMDSRGRGQRARAEAVWKARDQLAQTLQRRPTDAEVAEAMGIQERSLHAATLAPEASIEVVAVAAPERDDSGFEAMIANLSERNQQICRMRFLECKTLQEIGYELGRSQERIRQILESIFARL